MTIGVDVVNEGKYKASDVLQLYLIPPKTTNLSGKYRSEKDLKAFKKVTLDVA